jgi:hypothetical protein
VPSDTDACAAWNSRATCGSLHHYFQPVSGTSAADVIVTLLNDQDTCAQTMLYSISGSNRSTTPDQIQLMSKEANNEASAARTIEHELGHVTGLGNSEDTSQCAGAQSIMSLASPLNTCLNPTNINITTNDVAQINKNATNPSQCVENVYDAHLLTTSCPKASLCPREGGYLVDGPDDPCQYPGNGCPNSADAFFSSVGCCYESQSPIIIDLHHSGFKLTDEADGVYFDFKDSGSPILVSWLAAQSGNAWLALDRNGDGRIDSGSELFGNYTVQQPSANPNGFLALAEFDKPAKGGNGDGVIDHRDAVFAQLLLWIDDNHNGISEPGELHSLAEFGITAIDLSYHMSDWQDSYGNVFRFNRMLKN